MVDAVQLARMLVEIASRSREPGTATELVELVYTMLTDADQPLNTLPQDDQMIAQQLIMH